MSVRGESAALRSWTCFFAGKRGKWRCWYRQGLPQKKKKWKRNDLCNLCNLHLSRAFEANISHSALTLRFKVKSGGFQRIHKSKDLEDREVRNLPKVYGPAKNQYKEWLASLARTSKRKKKTAHLVHVMHCMDSTKFFGINKVGVLMQTQRIKPEEYLMRRRDEMGFEAVGRKR